VNLAEHLRRACKVETTFWLQLSDSGKDVMGAVDIRIHSRETISKTFCNKALSSQMIALIELRMTEHLKDGWVTLKATGMQFNPVANII
jgi:hypothetical protein